MYTCDYNVVNLDLPAVPIAMYSLLGDTDTADMLLKLFDSWSFIESACDRQINNHIMLDDTV